MAITLTTPITLPNVTTWTITKVDMDDANLIGKTTIEFRTTTSTLLVASVDLIVRNGLCTKISKVAATSGGLLTSALQVTTITLASGYTNAVNAWRVGGATPALRGAALEAHFLSVGIVDSTLTGS